MAIPVVWPADAEVPSHFSASCHHWVKSDDSSQGWHDMKIGREVDTMETRLILCHEVWTAVAVQILY
jgi:hypothetical protein